MNNDEWKGWSKDLSFKLMGNVFESEAEAKCHVEEIIAKYKQVM